MAENLAQLTKRQTDKILTAMKLDSNKDRSYHTDSSSGGITPVDPAVKVTGLNGLNGAITLVGGSHVSITVNGQAITIAADILQSLLDLTDVPDSYAGMSGKALVVKGSEDGVEFANAQADYDRRIVDPFKQGTHNGLTFAYSAGVVRSDNQVTKTDAGTVSLTDNTTNYIEVNAASGQVTKNTTGYSSGLLPLYKVTASNGAITSIEDDRCFFSNGGNGGASFLGTIANTQSVGSALSPLASEITYPS